MVIIRSRISSTIRASAKIQNALISLLRNNVIMQVSSAGILTLNYLDSTWAKQCKINSPFSEVVVVVAVVILH